MKSPKLRPLLLLFAITLFSILSHAGKPEWVEVRSKHFLVITDDGEKSGRGVALRFEQMRSGFTSIFQKATVNDPVPLQIVAFRSGKELKQYGPIFNGKPVELAGFFQLGEDRNFIALDLSAPNGWATVFHEYGHLLLNNNLKSMPLWFDEGYADFLSTLDVSGKTMAFGTFPQGYGELLADSTWMKTSELFAMTHKSRDYNEGSRRHILYAQSWLTVHYILMNRKGAEVDAYLNLTERQHLSAPEAFKRAFGMTTEQFDQELKSYFHGRMEYFRAPAPPEEGGPYVVKPLKDSDRDALLADFKFHTSDHLKEGMEEFKRILAADPDNQLANRGLGYAYIRQRDFAAAAPYLKRASESGSTDPRIHFFNAMLLSQSSSGMYHVDRDHLEEVRAELKKSLELDPNYGDAYNLLAYTDSVDGDYDEAIKNQAKAVNLSPRNNFYLMNLATYEMRAEKWDQASELLKSLISSGDQTLAASAQENLEQLEHIQNWKKEHPGGNVSFDAQTVETTAADTPASLQVDSVKVLPSQPATFLKGKLVSVDCNTEPQAILEIKSASKVYHLRTKDRNKLVVIGADQLSCAWKDKAVAVNFWEIGEEAGNLISLELQ
jgi:tetratricopeptide (TPR) repeat protein